MAEEKQKNIFESMEAEGNTEEAPTQPELLDGEINYDKLSDIPVGLEGKYDRPNLNGKEVKILSAKLFGAAAEDEEILAINGSGVKYKKCKFIITYDSKNKDGINNREYYSGAIQFMQKNNTLSLPVFWNEGAKNQTAGLWEKVAEFKKIKPEELSKKAFIAFLNSGIKVKLAQVEARFPGQPAIMKNLVSQIIG